MNWMIDGLYGDDYRIAMGYRALTAHDEWEIERQTGTKHGLLLRSLAGIQQIWAKGRVSLLTAGTYTSAKERSIS